MKFVVAGGMLLIAWIVGVVSYAITPYFDVPSNDEEEKNEIKGSVALAITVKRLFCRENVKQVMLICLLAILCAVAAFRLYDTGMTVLAQSKLLSVALLLIPIMMIDWEYHRIPNVLVLVMLLVGSIFLLFEFVLYRTEFNITMLTSMGGLIFCVALFYILSRLTKDGLGMGDVKLIAAIGWILGLSTTMLVIIAALILSMVTAIVLLVGKKKNTSDTLPFGPFVFFGYILMLILFGV